MVAAALMVVAVLCTTRLASAANVLITHADPIDEGFNDSSPASPVGLNTGTTLGEQRLLAVQAAADRWGSLLNSDVDIVVLASFSRLDLGCSEGVVAALAGPAATAMLGNLAYPIALANKRMSVDLDPSGVDIEIDFNPQLDSINCLDGRGWYYGLDGNVPGDDVDLLNIALHELAHGLGFSNLVTEADGTARPNFPDVYSNFTYDLTQQAPWTLLSQEERAASVRNARGVVWSGPRVREQAAEVLARGLTRVVLHTPEGAQEPLSDHVNEVLPPYSFEPITAELIAVDAADACTELGDVAGRVVLVDDSICRASDKLVVAQENGAAGLIIGQSQTPPEALAVAPDFAVTLPAIAVDEASYEQLTAALDAAESVTVTIHQDMARLIGADSSGRPYLFASGEPAAGSAITHWDPLVRRAPGALPRDLLMEADVMSQRGDNVDLTLAVLEDLGWADTTCGNGMLDGTEECDDGPLNDDMSPDQCRRDCRRPRCGDGTKDDAEACDNGALNSGEHSDACREDCSAARCGDAVVDFLRQEECDDGTENSDEVADSCRQDCRRAYCGDGVTDNAEACDDGEDNSEAVPNACRENCELPSCGDGVMDDGEECDDGEENGPRLTLRMALRRRARRIANWHQFRTPMPG